MEYLNYIKTVLKRLLKGGSDQNSKSNVIVLLDYIKNLENEPTLDNFDRELLLKLKIDEIKGSMDKKD